MSEEQTTEQPAPTEPKIEEPTVNLKDELAKGLQHISDNMENKLESLSKSDLTAEQIEQFKEILESAQSSAADGAARKAKETLEKEVATGKYLTPEQAQSQIDLALKKKDAIDEAYRQYDRTLLKLGIEPDSEDAKKIATEYENLGANPAMLQSEKGVRALALIAGVIEDPSSVDAAAKAPGLGFGAHTVMQPKEESYKPGDLDQKVRDEMLKGLGS
jgi:hypothetical protein